MDRPKKMSFSVIKGSDSYADTHLMTFDGFVIPFHTWVFFIRGLQGCKFEIFIRAQSGAAKTPVRLEFDGQTVWRVISFLYDGTYQDEDEDLTFPKVEPPASPTSVNRLSDAPPEHQDVALVQGFRNLHITAHSCTSDTLLKALASVKVYQAASAWDIDRLMVEAAQRFGGYVTGAYDKDDFPRFVEAVLNSVSGPAELLYNHLVKECFVHCQHLAKNTNFLAVLEHNGKLAVRLFRDLAKRQASSNDGASPPASSSLGAGSSASASPSASASSAVALLQTQLTESRNAISAKDEQIRALEQEVTDLKESNQQKISSADVNARTAELSAAKNSIIDKLESDLNEKDEQINDLERKLADINKRSAVLVDQINSKRAGQPDNTAFLLERNEALEKVSKLQSSLTASEEKVNKLEAQLAIHAQQSITINAAFIPQPSTNGAASRPHASQPTQSSQAAESKRPIHGFGSMTASVNSIAAGSASAAAPPIPTSPTPSARLALAPAAQNLNSSGPVSFFEKLQRSRAAGIHGGENQSATSSQTPPSMPVSVRGESTAAQQPVRSPSVIPSSSSTVSAPSPANGAPRGPHAALGRQAVGPHSPRSNGVAHTASTTSSVTASPHVNGAPQHVAPHVNGTPQHVSPHLDGITVVPSVASASDHTAGPAGTPSAAPVGTRPTALSAAPVRPTVASGGSPSGQGNNSPDERDRTIARLRADLAFHKSQLNTLRFGPSAPSGPPGPFGGNGGNGGNSRLKNVLKALKEYDLDHKACNDCSINFNAQWRGIVDNINNPDLILICNKCGNEKCRWHC